MNFKRKVVLGGDDLLSAPEDPLRHDYLKRSEDERRTRDRESAQDPFNGLALIFYEGSRTELRSTVEHNKAVRKQVAYVRRLFGNGHSRGLGREDGAGPDLPEA